MMKPKPTAKDRMMMLKKKHVRDVEKDTNKYPDGTVEKSKSVFRKDGGQKVKIKTTSPNGEVKKTKIVRK